jgi:serine/threonine protein kinase
LIHRDLKPANLLLSEDLCAVKISDFGLARELDSTHGDKGMGAVTLRGQIIGTPRYLSPEYVDQGITDVRSDIYALGLVGYELIAGLPAYSGNSVAQVLIEKLKSEPRPLHQVAPNCPPELSGVIHKAIALDPAERFSTAEEFKIALQRVAAILEARGPHRYPGATLASFLSSIPVGVRKFVVATLVGGVYLLLFAGLLWRLR